MPNLAIYDFDHTLTTKDSFFVFLGFLCGKVKSLSALLYVISIYPLQSKELKNKIGFKSFVKTKLIDLLVTGRTVEDCTNAAIKARQVQVIKNDVFDTLIDHLDKGNSIVIASGALSLYLPELVRDIPNDGIICTNISTENGIVTGKMTNGNCVRFRKKELIQEWIETQEKKGIFFDEIYAYGNPPDDDHMMELAHHKTLITK